MSIRFYSTTADLWFPSNNAARLFVSATKVLEVEYGLSSGIADIVSDEAHVSAPQLGVFVDQLIAIRTRTNNSVVHGYIDPTIGIALVLLERCGICKLAPAAISDLACKLKRVMPI